MKTSRNGNNKRVFTMSMKEKLAVTVLVTTLALFGLVVVLYRMIKDKIADYTQIVLNQHSSYDSRTIPYRRGDIVDRNGTYLATSEKVYNLILDPNQINQDKDNYLEPTVSALCEVFGYDRAQITSVGLSTTAFFQSFTTALKIRTQTQTRIPAKAFWTIARCAKFWINAAMTVMMIRDGNTTPRVATIPPIGPASP